MCLRTRVLTIPITARSAIFLRDQNSRQKAWRRKSSARLWFTGFELASTNRTKACDKGCRSRLRLYYRQRSIMPDLLVKIDAVEKIFPGSKKPALAGLTMGIRSGRVTGLIGPDGAGKTTLMRLLAGLL